MRAASSRRAQLAALLALLAAAPAAADGDRVAATKLPTCTDGEPFLVYIVDATADDDCDATGGGTTEAPCLCLDGAYVAMLASGGAASDSFKTQNTPSGTDPVADSSTDTLNWTAGTGITLTGDSTTDTITVASTIPSITLDLGDDAGNDSTALAEIATSGDDYSVVTEPSADKALLNFAKVPPYRQYDPARPPSSCASCEEWSGDIASLSWSWGNQGTATETLEMDGATISGPQTTATALRVRCVAAPAAADFTVHSRVSGSGTATFNHWGIALLQGTLATPTRIDSITPTSVTDSAIDIRSQRYTNYSTYGAGHADTGDMDESSIQGRAIDLRIAFTDSSNVADFAFSYDGRTYITVGASIAISANPDFVCIEVNSEDTVNGVVAHFQWLRIRTDSGRSWPSD